MYQTQHHVSVLHMYVYFQRKTLMEIRHSACNSNFVNLAAVNAFKNTNQSKYMYLQAIFVGLCISFY